MTTEAPSPTDKSRVWRRRDCREPLLVSARALDAEYPGASIRQKELDQGVYVLEVCGPLEHHHNDFFDNFHDIARCVGEALDSPDVKAVVLRIDSPGGVANGMASTSRAIRKKADRLGKPIFAYADEQICSAAYGLACAADEIWGPPTAEIGSVGVILPVVDQTEANEMAGVRVELLVTGERKGDGHPDKPLDQAAVDALQSRVDAIGRDFFDLVADARGMTPEAVDALQAGVFVGEEAVAAGLSDGVADWQTFFDLVVTSVSSQPQATGAQIPQARTASKPRALDKQGKSSPTKSVTNGTASVRRKAVDMAREKRLAIAKAKQEAEAAIAAAAAIVDPKARAEAISAAVSGAFEASSRYFKKTIKVEESIDDDGPKDDAEDEEEKKSNGRYAEDEDGEEDDDDDKEPESERMKSEEDDAEDDKEAEDDAEEEDDEEKKTSAEDRKDPYKTRKASIVGVARAITGGKTKAEVLGRLDAMAEKAKRYDAVAQDVERMKATERTAKIDSLVQSAIKAGKVGPKDAAMHKQLRAIGSSSPKRLAAFVEAMPRIVPRTIEEGVAAPAADASGDSVRVDVLAPQTKAIIESTARLTGQSVEKITADYIAAYNRAAGR